MTSLYKRLLGGSVEPDPEPPAEPTLTVACVLRSGGRYDAEWVARLQRGVARHLSLSHRFVCLSDVDVPCERIPLTEDWPGWWSKISLFRPGLLTGRTLYLDLDSVIVGSLDAIAAHRHRFTGTHEYYRPHLFCSTAMAWEGDWSMIWDAFRRDPDALAARYDRRSDHRIGDQAFIEDVLAANGARFDTFRDLFGERSIASWKVHCRDKGLTGEEAVVAFHGGRKQDDFVRRVDWIRENWT